MNIKQYKASKDKYGDIASWAIWKMPGEKPKSNMRDVSMFDDESIISQLNCNYVFIGLNGSGVHDDYMDNDRPWHNFHSNNPHGNDYKLRYATMNTPIWGAYITDVIKKFQEVDSSKVKNYLKKHPDFVRENIDELKTELNLLGSKPILIALGSDVYKIISHYLSNEYDIRQIHHYSYSGINKESYRDEVLSVLGIEASAPIKRNSHIGEKSKESKTRHSYLDDGSYKPSKAMSELLTTNLKLTGLDKDSEWDGDNRDKLIKLYSGALKNGKYELKFNLTDTTKKVINLFRQGESQRIMGFEKRKNKMFMIFPTTPFYDEIKRKYPLPAPNPKKSQPHILISHIQLWELFCVIGNG